MISYSVIICTWQPDEILLGRVIESVMQQETAPKDIILVDNNSAQPVAELQVMKAHASVKCVEEAQQGLTHARIAGAHAATGEYLIFVDDDNILARNYLTRLSELTIEYPDVAVWGPGNVLVEYQGSPPAWLKKNFGHLFQEKKMKATQSGSVAGWPEYYPAGSSMAVRRDVFEKYTTWINEGRVTSIDRKGTHLSSAGDSQIVWTAVKMALKAGTDPLLKITHVISEKKQTMSYLRRLQFGIARSYYFALAEMFPEKRSTITPLSFPGYIRLALLTIGQARFNPFLALRLWLLHREWFRGLKKYHELQR